MTDLGEDRWLEFLRRTGRAFQAGRRSTEEDLAPRRALFERSRLSGVVDRDRLVATFRTWDAPVTVPGASVVTDMISGVTVDPTRRRRGLLTAMMLRDLRRAREAGTVMVMLVASEAPIYGRFGFGHALGSVDWRVDQPAPVSRWLPPGTDDVEVDLVEDADLVAVAPAVYAAAAMGQPGAIAVPAERWGITLGAVDVPGEDAARLRPALVARLGDEVVGYARYQLPEGFDSGRYTSELAVADLAATTPAALAALWRQLLGIDLVATVKAVDRPRGDLLPELLADRRRAQQVGQADAYWVRLLDVPAALAARRFSAPVDVVVDVADPLGLSGGRWRVRADPAGESAPGGRSGDGGTRGAGSEGTGTAAGEGLPAEVTASTASPDVELDVAALSAAYLGETPLVRLHATGRVVERTPGAVRRLGAALAWEPTTAPTLHGF